MPLPQGHAAREREAAAAGPGPQVHGQIEIICANSQYTRDNVRRVYGRSDAQLVTPIARFPARGLLLVGRSHGGPNEILDGGRLGWTSDPFAPESPAESFSDAELDARRNKLEESCRNRFSEAVVGPQLERTVLGTRARSFTSA